MERKKNKVTYYNCMEIFAPRWSQLLASIEYSYLKIAEARENTNCMNAFHSTLVHQGKIRQYKDELRVINDTTGIFN